MKTGAHIKKCNVGSVELHNERAESYLQSVEKSGRSLYFFHDLTDNNYSWVNTTYEKSDGSMKTCAEIFEELKNLYKEKHGRMPMLADRVRVNKKTGKEYTLEGWSPIREAVIPIKANTDVSEFRPVQDWFEAKGVTVIRVDLHHDEGYQEADGTRKLNHHAHMVLDWVDHNTGKTAKLGREDMQELQDIVAKALDMERGESKAISGKEHLSPELYREKAAEQHIAELTDRAAELKKSISAIEADRSDLTHSTQMLEQHLEELAKMQQEAKREAEAAKSDAIEQQQKLKELNRELSEVQAKADKAHKELLVKTGKAAGGLATTFCKKIIGADKKQKEAEAAERAEAEAKARQAIEAEKQQAMQSISRERQRFEKEQQAREEEMQQYIYQPILAPKAKPLRDYDQNVIDELFMIYPSYRNDYEIVQDTMLLGLDATARFNLLYGREVVLPKGHTLPQTDKDKKPLQLDTEVRLKVATERYTKYIECSYNGIKAKVKDLIQHLHEVLRQAYLNSLRRHTSFKRTQSKDKSKGKGGGMSL